jgi:hypothetical protein
MRFAPEYRNDPGGRCERRFRPGQALDESVDGNIAANTKRNGEQQRKR